MTGHPTVLVLEDDDAVRESLCDYLEDRGWSVLAAATAGEALDLLARHRPRVALVDLRLPDMDGTAFIRAAHQRHPDLRFAVVTGSRDFRLPTGGDALPGTLDTVCYKPVASLERIHRLLEPLAGDAFAEDRKPGRR